MLSTKCGKPASFEVSTFLLYIDNCSIVSVHSLNGNDMFSRLICPRFRAPGCICFQISCSSIIHKEAPEHQAGTANPATHLHILRRDAGDSLTSLLNDLRRTMVYTSLLFRHIDRICYFSPADVLVISSQTVSGGGYELCSGKYSNDGLIIPRFRFPALYFEAI